MTKQKAPKIGLLLMLVVALSVTACGKRTPKSEATTAPTAAKESGKPVDMTRPPRTIGVEREIVVEGNPDETISFEEWKRRQDAAADSPSEPE